MTTDDPFADARWIARPVSPALRPSRETRGDRVDWAIPGSSLSQTFTAPGPVAGLSLDLVAPRNIDAYRDIAPFSVTITDVDGAPIATKVVEEPVLVWDRFGFFMEVDPPVASGEYRVTLRAEMHAVGWTTASRPSPGVDDGVSPLPIRGVAFDGDDVVDGIRLICVEPVPAPNPVFSTRFDVSGEVQSAQLASVALGNGVIRINGAPVGRELLEPAVTNYDKRVLYRPHDVTHLLRQGDNEIEIFAGRDRFSTRGGDNWGWNVASWNREPIAICRLDVVTDSGTQKVVTNESWQARPGPVRREIFFGGEDWTLAAPNEPERARAVTPPQGALQRATHDGIIAAPAEPPVSADELPDGSNVYDFGRLLAGRLRLRVSGSTGGRIVVRSGEQRDADGTVICDNTLAAGRAQEDTLTFGQDIAEFEWEPMFSYRGFRWAQVEVMGPCDVTAIRAVPLVTPLDSMGTLRTTDPLFEWIDSALATTFVNNLHGVPTDTPIYEKNGWTADAHLATEGLLHHFDLRSAFGKWLDDHVDAQQSSGAVPQMIPTPGWGSAADPAWSSSAVLLPWYLYREYGDLDILRRYAPMIEDFGDHLVARLNGGLWPDRTWGDWLAPGYNLGPERMPVIGTIVSAGVLGNIADVLQELGNPRSDHFGAAAAATGRVYHDAFFDEESGSYRDPVAGFRQGLNILPLAFDVVPDHHVAAVRRSLIADIEERTDGHLDCGAVAVRHLLPVLSAAGRDDLAIDVLTRRDRPGWGAWFEDGERTLLESWDEDARSRNHYFLGSVASWIQQRIGGIRLTAPGWSHFEVAPVDDPRVTGASITHNTPHGRATLDWTRGPGGWRFDLLVPSGSRATVAVDSVRHEVGSGRHTVHIPSANRTNRSK